MIQIAPDRFFAGRIRPPDAHKKLAGAEAGVALPRHLGQEFLISAERHALQPAFVTDQLEMSYCELAELTLGYAARLQQSAGWRPGKRVALQLGNSVDYIAAFYGILIAGGVAVPLPLEQSRAWVDQVVGITEAQWRIDSTGIQCSASNRRRERPDRGEDRSVDLNLAAIFFTSGSTGSPKGVMLSHDNFLANSASICGSLPIKQSDRTLALLPFCHAFGNSVLQSHLLSGAALVVAGTTAFPEAVVDAMERHAVTSYSGVPHLHQLLLRGSRLSRQSVRTLRYATVAGGALRQDLLLELADRLRPAQLYVMYGQTEATARLSCLPADELRSRSGSIGRGIPGVTLEVVDEQNRPVPPGITGEIRARGDNIMLGYWQDVDATKQILQDNWLFTGDLATVDQDGYIYPHGRKSQLLKICGYRLHPGEVERTIAQQLPDTDPVIVPYVTPDGSDRLALFLIPLKSQVTRDLAAVRCCCARSLPRHQRPDYVTILEAPPLTPSLKIDRQLLSRWAAEAVRRCDEPQKRCV